MRLRRRVVIGLALWLCRSHAAIAQSPGPVAEVEGLRLFSDFWLNLHISCMRPRGLAAPTLRRHGG